MSYWDTSALVKLYTKEPDSPTFEQLVLQSTAITTSRLALFELRRTLRRKEMEGCLRKGASQTCLARFQRDVHVGLIQLLGWGTEIEPHFDVVLSRCLGQTPSILIRTADAIHLASALAAQQTELVCTDTRMRAAAQCLGLSLRP